MHTLQIADGVLAGYRNEKLTQERLDFLLSQAEEQLDEMATNSEVYSGFLERAHVPQTVDRAMLWVMLMSDEGVVEDYIDEYGKSFREIIPVSDLADLLLYAIHLKKVEGTTLDGLDEILEDPTVGMDEADQYAFTNVLLYIQQQKEAPLDFNSGF